MSHHSLWPMQVPWMRADSEFDEAQVQESHLVCREHCLSVGCKVGEQLRCQLSVWSAP
jgi:hypothetical protein